MHTGKTINYFGDKKYVYQYLTNFKYYLLSFEHPSVLLFCIPSNKKLFDFYFPIFGNLINDLKVF